MGRPHGLDGSFFVEDASESEERLAAGARLLVDGVEARVVARKQSAGRPVIRLDRSVPRGATLAVRRSDLPPPAEDAYYVFQLVGLLVEEDGGRALGRVSDIVPAPANDVLELDSGLALPLVEDCVRHVDVEHGRIVIARGFADPD